MKAFNPELSQLLAKRKLSISKVADLIYTGRCHLGLVLMGRRNGTVTWRKLKAVLSPEEYECARNFAVAPDNAAKAAVRASASAASVAPASACASTASPAFHGGRSRAALAPGFPEVAIPNSQPR